MVEEILPRKNFFVRPAVSNLDVLVIFSSNVIPVTEPFLIDRVTAIAGNQNVPVILCVNKIDTDAEDALTPIYQKAGYPTIRTSAVTGEGIETLWAAIAGKTAAFTGNSGVGKSSILNRLAPDLSLKVGDVSEKLAAAVTPQGMSSCIASVLTPISQIHPDFPPLTRSGWISY